MFKYISWRNWAVIEYNSLTENFFLFFYLALRFNQRGYGFVADVFLFYLFAALATSYGYLVNDYGDKELDRVHGKENIFHGDSNLKSIIVVLLFFVAANITGSLYFSYTPFLYLWIAWIFVTTFYSLPPIRFKERGFWGIIAVVPAQRIIPALLTISVFGRYDAPDIIIIVCYVAIRGLMSDILHQIEDYHNDLSTETGTFVKNEGLEKAKKIFSWLLVLNLIFQLLLYGCCFIYLDEINFNNFAIPVSLPLLLLFVISAVIYMFNYGKEIISINPYTDMGLGNFIHIGLPSFYFPVFLILLHLLKSPSSSVLLLFFLLIKGTFSIDNITNSLPVRLLSGFFNKN